VGPKAGQKLEGVVQQLQQEKEEKEDGCFA
jgi:hypothetical protein